MYRTEENKLDSGGWDNIFYQLSFQPRRRIIESLVATPETQHLPLPVSAYPSADQHQNEKLTTILQHSHLPELAEAGYIQWETEPFTVEQGPRFDEIARVVTLLKDAGAEFLEPARTGSDYTAYDRE